MFSFDLTTKTKETKKKMWEYITLRILYRKRPLSEWEKMFANHISNKTLIAETGGFPGGTSGKESTCQCRRLDLCFLWLPRSQVALQSLIMSFRFPCRLKTELKFMEATSTREEWITIRQHLKLRQRLLLPGLLQHTTPGASFTQGCAPIW